jgi:Animal haem peroxidase
MKKSQSYKGHTSGRVTQKRRRSTVMVGITLGATALLGTTLSGTSLDLGASAQAAGTTCQLGNSLGHLFPAAQPASWTDSELTALSEAVTEVTHQEPAKKGASDEMKNIQAGYTYVGQFIDHDVVLDASALSLSPVDVSTLTNQRTPQLDLDSVYGQGPTGSPALYEDDGIHLKLGAPLSGASNDPDSRDVVRGENGQAILGDPRDDENRIVASLHSILTRYHNKIADSMLANGAPEDTVFASASQQVRWHYQWAVATDFLPKMTGTAAANDVISRSASAWKAKFRHYDSCRPMPVEFAAASYRFGHSMVRNDYAINQQIHRPILSFSTDPRDSLVGFSPSPSDFAVDWSMFLNSDKLAKGTPKVVQNAYRMDNSLVPELRMIPAPAINGLGPTILSTRTLLRGRMDGLPTGQDVARSMGLKPLPDDKIIIGPATGDGQTRPITSISPAFAGRAPLWTYILAEAVNEATDVKNGNVGTKAGDWKLGPVGSRIVNETIGGLLAADPTSIVNNPQFTPTYGNTKGKFGFDDLIDFATS